MDITNFIKTFGPYLSEGMLALIFLIFTLRRPLGRYFSQHIPDHFQHRADAENDNREFKQQIQLKQLEAELAEVQQRYEVQKKREDQFFLLLSEYHTWGRDLIHNDLIELRADFNDKFEILERKLRRLSKAGRTPTQEILLNRIEDDE